MATRLSVCFYLFLILLPTFASCIRPFRVPRNLFVQGTSPFTLPEGARVIRREADEPELENPQELVEDLRGRFRRESPIPEPQPEKSSRSLASGFDTLYMYWPPDSEKESNVFLLAKNVKRGSKSISKVYVSKNYGKNFTDLDAQLVLQNGTAALIDQIYSSKADPKLCILADKKYKVLFRSEDLETFKPSKVNFVPSYITFHASDAQYAMAYDSSAEKLYWSSDKGKTFNPVLGKVKSFNWGVEGIHQGETAFIEKFKDDRDTSKDNRTEIYQLANGQIAGGALASDVEEFEMMKNYMFITTRKNPGDKNPILKVAKVTKGQPVFSQFRETQFPLNEESRDFFVFDVVEDYVFVVINHMRNLSNMYLSDANGIKYQLSLPRVLYHNPYTDVSSPWLRTVIPYAFVDVDRVKGMRGIYLATQLTPGPVGKRHLLSLITYNRGGKWQKVRSPTVDNRGVRINCYLPSCSIHLNLLYGAVYRVSPSERLFSSESAPGLVLGLGVASTNLKIYPDLFMSLDGGLGWSRVLRGKYLFTFGDHGGVIVAVPFRRYTRILRYSIDGGATWKSYTFSSNNILARDVVTQPGERLPVFLIYGAQQSVRNTWTVFYLNMTSVLGPVCDSSGYTTWTDGCLLGRQQQFETRNWTIHCHMSRDYSRSIFLRNCPCTRDDFQCDYGFERKSIEEECTPIRQGEDLDHQIIPNNCTEGANYTRTRGFRKITGDTCVNGSEDEFLPVITPCPVQELYNLSVTCSNVTEDGFCAIVTGGTASFMAGVQKGYYPNINFRWFCGDGHEDTGAGKKSASQQHKYDKPGKYIVAVVASNTRSILVTKLELTVVEKLDANKVAIKFHPKNPGVDEDVIFSANLNYSNEEVGNVHYKWKYEEGEIQGWQPVATLRFAKPKTYIVHITVKNYVSSVKLSQAVQVIIDLTPMNVTASVLGPSKVLVQWKPPAKADSSIKYKVYQSSSGNVGYQEASCAWSTSTSCTVDKLTPATTYYFKVQAVNAQGDKGPLSHFAVATTNTTTPGAPVDLHAYPLSDSSIKVEWKAPPNPNGQITSYIIKYWSHHLPLSVRSYDNGLKLSKVFTGLSQDTYYFFEVYAKSSSGRSISVGPVEALTKLSKPTLPPREIKKVSDNGTCAVFTWMAPYLSLTDNRTFPAKGYKVQVDSKPAFSVPKAFAVVCQLTPGKEYVVKILAYSQAGDGPMSPIIKFSTQTIKPGAPRDLRCTPASATQLTLTWNPPLQSSSGVTGYEIYQENPYKAKPFSVGENPRSFKVQGLKPFTTYRFSILAKNSMGSSVRSSPVECTTQQDTPGIVEYVTAEAIKPRSASIRITWSTPKNPNGDIRQYKIKWGKTVVDEQTDLKSLNQLLVNGSTHAYTFKHLFSSTTYSFVVIPKNGHGEGARHRTPKTERTYPAKRGTERLKLEIDGANIEGDEWEFITEFIKAASKKAGILDDRLAAVEVKERGIVLFDLLLPLSASGVPMEKAKSALNAGFSVSDWMMSAGSLKRVSVYTGSGGEISPSPVKPTVAAQRGGGSGSSSSKKTYLAIGIPLAMIVIALLGGMIFYFMKYKSLEKHYRQMGDQNHEEDEMKDIYHEDLQGDSPDVIFSDRTKKGRSKVYRDSEKVPLEEHDELAMI